MTMIRRSLAALASPSTAARACVLAIGLSLVATANAATTHVHRVGAVSEKPAPALQSGSAHEKNKEQSRHAGAAKAAVPPKAKDRAKPQASHGRKSKPRDPEPVDDPIPVHRASRNPEKVPAKRMPASEFVLAEQASKNKVTPKPSDVGQRSARDRREAHAHPEASPRAPATDSETGDAAPKQAASGKLTVDDFVRAAGGPAMDAEPDASPVPSPVVATREPVAPITAQQKPAPIVRRAPPVVVEAQVKSADLEPLPTVPDETVDGFGAEIETAAPHVPARVAGKHVSEDAKEAPAAEARAKITDDAMQPLAAPLYTRSGKLIVPLPLKGTREILMHQNQMADEAGLTRIQDDDDLNRMRNQHLLSSFPEMAGLEVNEDLPMNRRYARPWTVKFVTDIAKAYFTRFHEPLRLNSAVRTVEYQLRLQRVNGNAAAVEGETASPHLTGQAIDFGKHGMSVAEIAWMRSALLPLMQAGKIDVEEEFQQACFHISVYASYAPKKRIAPKTELAQLRRE